MHQHCGLVGADEPPPDNEVEALAWIQRRETALVDLVWQVMTGLASRRVSHALDAGCGQGATLARLVELAAPDSLNLTGITLSHDEIDIAAHYLPQATWLAGDMLADARLPTHRFDVVLAIQSIEYVGPQNLSRFMNRAVSWLAPEGLLMVAGGSWTSPTVTKSLVMQLVESVLRAEPPLTDAYRRAARAAGLQSLGELDLSLPVRNYWRVRRDCLPLRRSPGGVIEDGYYHAFGTGDAEYRLYVWRWCGQQAAA